MKPSALDALVIFLITFLLYSLLSQLTTLLPRSHQIYIALIFILEVGIVFLPGFIYASLKRFNIRETFSLRIPRPAVFGMALLVGLSGMFIIYTINYFLSPLFEPYQAPLQQIEEALKSSAQYNIYWMLFGTTITAAVCEELLFRGFILKGLISGSNKIYAVILSAVLFGLMHFIAPRILVVSLLGILFGGLLVLTDSILVPIIIHFVNNLLAVFLLLNVGGEFKSHEGEVSFLIPLMALVVFLGGIYWLAKYKSPLAGGKEQGTTAYGEY